MHGGAEPRVVGGDVGAEEELEEAEAKAAPVKETPAPQPAAVAAPKEEEKEKSLDDIILDFLAQEQKERNEKK